MLQKGAYLRGFLRYLDETFRISRAICDHYDPEVGNNFEPQKQSYVQKKFFCANQFKLLMKRLITHTYNTSKFHAEILKTTRVLELYFCKLYVINKNRYKFIKNITACPSIIEPTGFKLNINYLLKYLLIIFHSSATRKQN